MTEKVEIKSLLQASIEKGARQAEDRLLKAEMDRHAMIADGIIMFMNKKPYDPKLVAGQWNKEHLASDKYKKEVEKRTGWTINDLEHLFNWNEEEVKPYFKGLDSSTL